MKSLKELCDKISMPAEATDGILRYERLSDDGSLRASMEKLFRTATWKAGLAELKQHIGEDTGGFGILACELSCALKTFEMYEEHGISEEIYVDTMKCFSRFVKEHKESYGSYGFDREWWTPRQISGLLFRIGELEYEVAEIPDTDNTRSTGGREAGESNENEGCIWLHIPSDARLTAEAIEGSVHMARQFFAEKFPMYVGAKIRCESWLLSPTLKEVLPPSSKILGFQDYFVTKSLGIDEGEFMTWVFKRPDIPLKDLPESTSLQRNLKSYLLSGGKVTAAEGTLKDRDFGGRR